MMATQVPREVRGQYCTDEVNSRTGPVNGLITRIHKAVIIGIK